MDCLNFKIKSKKDNKNVTFEYVSDPYEEYKNSKDKGKIIHWLPIKKIVDVEVTMGDGSTKLGKGEEALECVNKLDIIQFERKFFGRIIEKKKNKLSCWFLHK